MSFRGQVKKDITASALLSWRAFPVGEARCQVSRTRRNPYGEYTWQGPEASWRQPPPAHHLAEWVNREADPPTPIEPSEYRSPGWNLDCDLVRVYELESPSLSTSKLQTHRVSREVLNVYCFRTLSDEDNFFPQQYINNTLIMLHYLKCLNCWWGRFLLVTFANSLRAGIISHVSLHPHPCPIIIYMLVLHYVLLNMDTSRTQCVG